MYKATEDSNAHLTKLMSTSLNWGLKLGIAGAALGAAIVLLRLGSQDFVTVNVPNWLPPATAAIGGFVGGMMGGFLAAWLTAVAPKMPDFIGGFIYLSVFFNVTAMTITAIWAAYFGMVERVLEINEFSISQHFGFLVVRAAIGAAYGAIVGTVLLLILVVTVHIWRWFKRLLRL